MGIITHYNKICLLHYYKMKGVKIVIYAIIFIYLYYYDSQNVRIRLTQNAKRFFCITLIFLARKQGQTSKNPLRNLWKRIT